MVEEKEEAIDVIGMACGDNSADFKPWKFKRRAPGEYDVLIDIKFCGVCHTDVHLAAEHFKSFGRYGKYPMVAGHEISGICTKTGSKVTKFKVGDQVGVGCMVDSCLNCSSCNKGREQNCKNKMTATYQGSNKYGRAAVYPPDSYTQGGYSTNIVIHERFAILIPSTYPLKFAGPVFCSGVTMYDPMKRYGIKNKTVGIVGLGGLGIMGLKIAKQLGCDSMTAFSRGEKKKEYALKECGADRYVDSTSNDQMKSLAKSFDIIIDTIPTYHDTKPYEKLLKDDASGGNDGNGKLIVVGANPTYAALLLSPKHPKMRMSAIGSIQATQEIINLCDRAKIYPQIQVVPVSSINNVFELLDSGNDKGIRYVLDIEGTLSEKTLTDGTCTAPPPMLQDPQTGLYFIFSELIRVNKKMLIKGAALATIVGVAILAFIFRRH